MKELDLVQHTTKPMVLCICEVIDYHNGQAHLRQITDVQGNINSQKPTVLFVAIGNKDFTTISWGGNECQKVMGSRSFPQWVALMTLPSTNQVQQQTQTTNSQKTYPIGSLIAGSKHTGNIWIVNKQNSRDVSLFWDAKNLRFCGSELERTDRIINKNTNHPTISLSDALDLINKTSTTKYNRNHIPSWAMNLMYITAQTPPQAAPLPTGMSPAVTSRLTDAGVLVPKKEIQPIVKRALDSFRESCDHKFVLYSGYTDSFEYCIHCDQKRAVAK